MGGKALKICKNIRLPLKTYQTVEKLVLDKASDIAEKLFVPRYSDGKESFGDLDVIIVPKKSSISFIDELQKIFSPREVVHSASVISIDFKEGVIPDENGDCFQVDFIVVPIDIFQISCFYYSFNDFGAILGGIFKNWGFSFGSYGLFHDICYKDDKTICLERLLVSTDVQSICRSADLDERFINHFFDNPHGGLSKVTWTQIFDWLTASKLFKAEFWTARSIHWNHSERKRTDLRPMYQEFLFNYIPTKYKITPDVEFKSGEIKQEFITKAEKFEFVKKTLGPKLWEDRETIIRNHEKQLLSKVKFSGKIVGALTGLETIELGKLMCHLKKVQPDTLNNLEWILANDQSVIDEVIRVEWCKYLDQ